MNLRLRPPDSGKVLLGRIETIPLGCVVFRSSNRRPFGREGLRLIFPEVIVIQTQHKEAYDLLTTAHLLYLPSSRIHSLLHKGKSDMNASRAYTIHSNMLHPKRHINLTFIHSPLLPFLPARLPHLCLAYKYPVLGGL